MPASCEPQQAGFQERNGNFAGISAQLSLSAPDDSAIIDGHEFPRQPRCRKPATTRFPPARRSILPRRSAFSARHPRNWPLPAASCWGQVARLTEELAAANGALRQQYLEKAALTERLTLLLDALPAGVVVLDGAGRVVQANPAAKGASGDTVVGAGWGELRGARLQVSETRASSSSASAGWRWP